MLNSWFDHSFWDPLLLQLSQAEPAICHAVIAVSALHEESLTIEIPLLRRNRPDCHHRFALEQYGRAISVINARMGSNDPALENSILVCSFLFVIFELLLGNGVSACTHLQKGVMILQERNSRRAGSYRFQRAMDKDVRECLTAVMMQLDHQAIYFGVSRDNFDIRHSAEPLEVRGIDVCTLAEARRRRDNILRRMCHLNSFYLTLSGEQIAAEWPTLTRQQIHICTQLGELRLALTKLELRLRDGAFNRKLERAIALLRLHEAICSLLTEFCLMPRTEKLGDKYTPRGEHVVNLAEQITTDILRDPVNSDRYPSLTMDVGVIEPLVHVSLCCRDPKVAQRALTILGLWPHREGLWTSDHAIQFISQTVRFDQTH